MTPDSSHRTGHAGSRVPEPSANAGSLLKSRPTALGPKPGPRQIAPKKASLVKQKKITKVSGGDGFSLDLRGTVMGQEELVLILSLRRNSRLA